VDGRHVGTQLKDARERRGLTLRQLSASTRIPINSLEALEAGLVSKLPGGIFSRAFVRAYASEVGIDPEDAVRDFVEQFQIESVTFGSPLVQEPPADVSSLDAEFKPWPGLMVLGAVAAAGLIATTLVVLWWRGSVSAAASEEPAPPPSSTIADSPRPASAPPLGSPAPTPPPVAVTPVQNATVQLTLAPEGPCWARITTDGKVAFEGLLNKGAKESHEAKDLLVLRVGDAGSCRIVLNGRPARALGEEGEVLTVRITPATVETFR
jgi:cytoskeletal protein RodZ